MHRKLRRRERTEGRSLTIRQPQQLALAARFSRKLPCHFTRSQSPLDNFVFIDSEFTPVTRRWLSLGAVLGDKEFYAHESDNSVLALAQKEFGAIAVGPAVLAQLSEGPPIPGPVNGSAAMARAIVAWAKSAEPCTLHICYDYSLDVQLLEDALEAAGLCWPANWQPCNLAILNGDPTAEAARRTAWSDCLRRHRVQQHHALADAIALQAAYRAQSGSNA